MIGNINVLILYITNRSIYFYIFFVQKGSSSSSEFCSIVCNIFPFTENHVFMYYFNEKVMYGRDVNIGQIWCNFFRTYIYNFGYYNPSVRMIDLAISISWQFHLLSPFLPEIYWKAVLEEIFSYFHFNVWSGFRTRALCLISQHTAY